MATSDADSPLHYHRPLKSIPVQIILISNNNGLDLKSGRYRDVLSFADEASKTKVKSLRS